MAIQVQIEGHGTAEFPDGTDPAVIERTVKQQTAQKGLPPGETSGGASDGVPEWGRKHPNVYAGVETALDLAPMLANFAKTTGVGIPAAAVINAGAKATQRKIAGESTTLGDVGMDALKGATVEGVGRGINAGIKGLADFVPQDSKNKAARWLMQSAMKFSTSPKVLTPQERNAITETMFKNKFLPNDESYLRLGNMVDANTKAVDDIISKGTAEGHSIDPDMVLDLGGLARLHDYGQKVKGVSPGYEGTVAKLMGGYRRGANPQMDMPTRDLMGAEMTIPADTLQAAMNGELKGGGVSWMKGGGGKINLTNERPKTYKNAFGTEVPVGKNALGEASSPKPATPLGEGQHVSTTLQKLPPEQSILESGVLRYTPDELNAQKRLLYKQLEDAYTQGTTSKPNVQAKKQLAAGIKKSLEALYPEVKNINANSAELLALSDHLARSMGRIGNRDVIGLGDKIVMDMVTGKAANPATAAAGILSLIDRPQIKARVAQMLYKANTGQSLPLSQWRKGAKYLAQVAAPAARTAFEGAMYSTDPLGLRSGE